MPYHLATPPEGMRWGTAGAGSGYRKALVASIETAIEHCLDGLAVGRWGDGCLGLHAATQAASAQAAPSA